MLTTVVSYPLRHGQPADVYEPDDVLQHAIVQVDVYNMVYCPVDEWALHAAQVSKCAGGNLLLMSALLLLDLSLKLFHSCGSDPFPLYGGLRLQVMLLYAVYILFLHSQLVFINCKPRLLQLIWTE